MQNQANKIKAAVILLESARSLWGFMRSDPALAKVEREAADRLYQESGSVLASLRG
jgi:hypothetical protein